MIALLDRPTSSTINKNRRRHDNVFLRLLRQEAMQFYKRQFRNTCAIFT